MAQKGIRSGASYKGYYKGYTASNRWQKNKIKKLERRLLANENDSGAEKALEIAKKKTYNRKKPGQKGWFHPQEHKLQKEMKSEVESIRVAARAKLAKLTDVWLDPRPTAIRDNSVIPKRGHTIPDQLFLIGFINEKRRVTANTRMASIRKR